MKGYQNLSIKQVTSNNITGKPLSFSYRSRSNSRDQRDNSRLRSPNKYSPSNTKHYYGNSNFKPPSRNRSPYPRSFNYQNKPTYKTNNTFSNNSRPQSFYYNPDGNRSRRRKQLRNVKNYINSLLDQEKTDEIMSNTENAESQNVSEEYS